MRDLFATRNRNPNFTGRKALLKELQTTLESGKNVALVSPDGTGKSQIADEHARLRVTDYDFRFWVRANDPAVLLSDYAALAEHLGIPYNEESDLLEAAEAVKNWLEQNRRWLLIFDDATSPETLKRYLPGETSGHVIITSTNPLWENVAQTTNMGALDRTEASELLRKITGQEDSKASNALAEILDDLPLALDLAGSYVKWTGVNLSRYLDLYKERLTHPVKDDSEVPNEVKSVWAISFEQLQAVSQEGVDLIELLAFLAPEDIPFDILKENSELLAEALELGFLALTRRGLIKSNERSVSIHPLIQTLALDLLDTDAQKTWIEATLQAMGSAFSANLDNLDTWPECARILPHVIKASEHAERLESGTQATSSLLNQVGLFLHRRGDVSGAKLMLERLLVIDEIVYGPDHPEVAIDLNNLGGILRLLGDLKGAKAMFERSLAIEESASESDPLKIAVRANNLGTVLRALGDLEGAKAMFERALVIDERSYGPNHFKTAIRLNNLGEVFQEMGKVDMARKNYQRALTVFQQFLGPGHQYTQLARRNLNSL